MRIFKYQLDEADMQYLHMPQGARALYVAGQHSGRVVLYAHVDPDRPAVPRLVWVHGTGHPTKFSEDAQPLGVVALAGGSLMLHVFIEPEGRVVT